MLRSCFSRDYSKRTRFPALTLLNGAFFVSLIGLQMQGRVNRPSFFQRLHVRLFIVRHAGLPTAEEDTNPFECERANDDMVGLALAGLVNNEIAGPDAVHHREARKLMKGLPQKMRAGAARIHHAHFAAAFGPR